MSEPNKFVVKYETTSALFAGQTIVNATSSEVIIDFSTGPIPGNGEQVLPIHTRVALSMDSAKRLAQMLNQATQPVHQDEARMPGL